MRDSAKRLVGSLFAVIAVQALSLERLSAADDETCGNKSQYTLFNPTPSNCMREFDTDRPDITESPITVDAGHVQTESDIVKYARSSPDEKGTVTEEFLFGSTNVRVGITNNAELDFLLQPINAVGTRTINPPRTTWDAGPDVLEARTKLNLYGDDGFDRRGATALALLPFVDIPTVHNGVGEDHVEGGIIVPFAVRFSDKATLGVMSEFDVRKNEGSGGYHVEYVNTASFGYELTDRLSTYAEVATLFGNQGPFGGIVTLDTGLLYEPRANLQFDVGINIGVTRAADPINPFVGLSTRF